MAIRMRRGNASDLDGSQLKSGEFAVTTNDGKVYIKATDTAMKRLLTEDDAATIGAYTAGTGIAISADGVISLAVDSGDGVSY